jgi:hypothetical protein
MEYTIIDFTKLGGYFLLIIGALGEERGEVLKEKDGIGADTIKEGDVFGACATGKESLGGDIALNPGTGEGA